MKDMQESLAVMQLLLSGLCVLGFLQLAVTTAVLLVSSLKKRQA